jgi:hypothetical protein
MGKKQLRERQKPFLHVAVLVQPSQHHGLGGANAYLRK